MDRTAGGGRSRIVWADMAKAVCSVLVVLRHVSLNYYQAAPWQGAARHASDAWFHISATLWPLLMPLFLVISGMFFHRYLVAPTREFLGKRVAAYYYLFALWLALRGGEVFHGLRSLHGAGLAEFLHGLGAQLLFTGSGLWYLYALVVYGVAARLTLRVPLPLALLGATVLSVWAQGDHGFALLAGSRYQVAANFVWFLVGARAPGIVTAVAGAFRAHPRLALPCCGAFCAVSWFIPRDGSFISNPLLIIPSNVLGIVSGIALCVFLARSTPRLVACGTWIGERTFPIYVIHVSVLVVWNVALTHTGVLPMSGTAATVIAAGYPIVLTVGLIIVSCALHELLRGPFPWLFAMPEPLMRMIVGASDRSSSEQSQRARTPRRVPVRS